MSRGAAAEALAAELLVTRGLVIVVRNYRCRRGEIDLIARDCDTLVDRVRAKHYLGKLGHEPPSRFDAILLDALDSGRIEWLRNVDV